MLKFYKKVVPYVMCMILVCVFAMPTYAANGKELITYHSDQIIPAESVISNQTANITYPSGASTNATIQPRMGVGVKLFSMTASSLSAGKLLTTLNLGNEKNVLKMEFPNNTAVIWSSLSSSSSSNVKVGFCRVDPSSGNFVADVYVYVPANGSSTQYPSVAGMNANSTYYGFINNVTSSSVSGTVDFGYLD